MAVKVHVPTPLQKLTNGAAQVSADGATISDVLADLEKQFPGIKERLYDEQGKLRRFINFYVNNEDIRFLQGEETALTDGDEISVVPAIAGGRNA